MLGVTLLAARISTMKSMFIHFNSLEETVLKLTWLVPSKMVKQISVPHEEEMWKMHSSYKVNEQGSSYMCFMYMLTLWWK